MLAPTNRRDQGPALRQALETVCRAGVYSRRELFPRGEGVGAGRTKGLGVGAAIGRPYRSIMTNKRTSDARPYKEHIVTDTSADRGRRRSFG